MKHKLIIESLHDARAECSCGHWYFIGTGRVAEREIYKEYRKHRNWANGVFLSKKSDSDNK